VALRPSRGLSGEGGLEKPRGFERMDRNRRLAMPGLIRLMLAALIATAVATSAVGQC
jgi:hypothetical protein